VDAALVHWPRRFRGGHRNTDGIENAIAVIEDELRSRHERR
jgi:hypothetical protein